jgi:hypothetical protein
MASNFSATHCHALAKRPLIRPEINRLTMGGQGQQLIWVETAVAPASWPCARLARATASHQEHQAMRISSFSCQSRKASANSITTNQHTVYELYLVVSRPSRHR